MPLERKRKEGYLRKSMKRRAGVKNMPACCLEEEENERRLEENKSMAKKSNGGSWRNERKKMKHHELKMAILHAK